MKPLFAAASCALLTVSCEIPGRECVCTEMYCLEGVIVELRNMPDSAEWEGVALSLQYGDTVEAASNLSGFGSRERQTFTSRKLVRLKPASIRLHLDYRVDGSENRITLDTIVGWTSRVCNACSGNSPSCKDQLAHNADLAWDLSGAEGLPASPQSQVRRAQPSHEVPVFLRRQDGNPAEPASGSALPQRP